jgi:hypothetical protein
MEGLPVVRSSNKEVCTGANLFESCFASELRHELKACCEEVKVSFKILFLLDDAPGHPYAFLVSMETLMECSCLPPSSYLLSKLWITVSLSVSRVITFGKLSPMWLRTATIKNSFL